MEKALSYSEGYLSELTNRVFGEESGIKIKFAPSSWLPAVVVSFSPPNLICGELGAPFAETYIFTSTCHDIIFPIFTQKQKRARSFCQLI
jgi:hypothetical protein